MPVFRREETLGDLGDGVWDYRSDHRDAYGQPEPGFREQRVADSRDGREDPEGRPRVGQGVDEREPRRDGPKHGC